MTPRKQRLYAIDLKSRTIHKELEKGFVVSSPAHLSILCSKSQLIKIAENTGFVQIKKGNKEYIAKAIFDIMEKR
jgi:hypothetical protein